MTTSKPLLIDDIGPALGCLTEFGQRILCPVAQSMQHTLRLFAAAHSWQTASHSVFARWVEQSFSPDLVWLVLDPLIQVHPDSQNVKALRLSRHATQRGWEIDAALPPELAELVCNTDVGLVDDVAMSGMTVRYVSDLVGRAGGRVRRVIVCASGAGTRGQLRDNGSVEWTQFSDGSWDAVHMRDTCPLLPFSGRLVRQMRPIATDEGPVDIAIPVTAFRGGVWGQLVVDSNLRHSIASAARLAVGRFSAALGRAATMADVPRLGTNIRVSIRRPAFLTSPLESVML